MKARDYYKLIKFNESDINGNVFTKDTDFGIITEEVFKLRNMHFQLEKRKDGIYIREILDLYD